jgi:hypothetical protein
VVEDQQQNSVTLSTSPQPNGDAQPAANATIAERSSPSEDEATTLASEAATDSPATECAEALPIALTAESSSATDQEGIGLVGQPINRIWSAKPIEADPHMRDGILITPTVFAREKAERKARLDVSLASFASGRSSDAKHHVRTFPSSMRRLTPAEGVGLKDRLTANVSFRTRNQPMIDVSQQSRIWPSAVDEAVPLLSMYSADGDAPDDGELFGSTDIDDIAEALVVTLAGLEL